PANYIAKWNGKQWSALGLGSLNGWPNSLTVFDDGSGPALFAGGFFTEAGGTGAYSIAKWNGSSWSALSQGLNESPVSFSAFDDGTSTGPALYVGGNFTEAGGVAVNRIAAWTGCPYQWTNPANGTFHSAGNWTNNRTPGAANLVLFGQSASNNIFNVN